MAGDSKINRDPDAMEAFARKLGDYQDDMRMHCDNMLRACGQARNPMNDPKGFAALEAVEAVIGEIREGLPGVEQWRKKLILSATKLREAGEISFGRSR